MCHLHLSSPESSFLLSFLPQQYALFIKTLAVFSIIKVVSDDSDEQIQSFS